MGSNALTNMFTGTGGTFTGTPTINTTYYIAGPAPAAPTTGFMVGEEHYDDFEEAVAAARTGSTKTVTCLSDIDLTQYPAYGTAGSMHYIDISGVTVDLDNHTMTIGGRWSTLFTGTNGKIMNGTCVGTPEPANYQYGLYIWGPGSGNLANSGGGHASIALENLTCNYGIHTWNADVTITNCDVTGSASYYAVWADEESYITVESGNYTTGGAAVFGCATSSDGQGHIHIEGGDIVVPAGKKLAQSGSQSIPENVKFSGGTVNVVIPAENCADGFAPVTTPNAQGKYTVGHPNDGVNITVADTISDNFYLDEDFYGEDAVVVLNYNNQSNISEAAAYTTQTVAIGDMERLNDAGNAHDGQPMFSITQAPAQATEPITIKVYANAADAAAGTNPVREIEYNTYSYCREIIEGEYADGLKELAESTLDYCAAAQTYFGYNTGNMATKDNGGYYNDFDTPDFSDVDSIYKPYNFTSASLVCKSDLEINLITRDYVEILGTPSLSTTMGGERFAVSTYQNGSYYVVHITGIEPANMNNTISISTTLGEIELTANSIMKAMAGSSNANLATLAKAMYTYGAAAEAYFA